MTHEELADLAKRLASYRVSPDDVPWDTLSEQERRNLIALTALAIQDRQDREERRSKANLRARALLRSFLTPAQRKEIRDRRHFTITGSAGGRYRLCPATGAASRIEKHGTRWFSVVRYCFHDPDNVMPPADVSLGQMLLILSDEPAFLAAANAKDCRSECLWNGDWLRRLAAARRARQQAAVEAA